MAIDPPPFNERIDIVRSDRESERQIRVALLAVPVSVFVVTLC